MASPIIRRPRLGLFPLAAVLLTFLLFAAAVSAEDGKFGGVGLQVVPTDLGELVVLKVVEKSPGAEAGLRPGDLIVQVDNFRLAGSDFAEVVPRRLWGKAGTSVTLKYLRPGTEGVRMATLRRIPLDAETKAPPGIRLLTPEDR